jgi:adenylate cyclase
VFDERPYDRDGDEGDREHRDREAQPHEPRASCAPPLDHSRERNGLGHNVVVIRGDLRRRLLELGATEEEIARADAQGWLPLLAMDQLLMPGVASLDVAELADASGFDEDLLRRLWRAVGFPDVPPGVRLFTQVDLDAAERLVRRTETDRIDVEAMLRQVRVVSAAMARVAAVEADALTDLLRSLRAAGARDEDVALELVDRLRWDDLAALIDYAHRIQLRAAMWRRLALEAEPGVMITIGFADLVGYTRLSVELEPDELEALLAHWEGIAYDAVAEHGARVIKTIGDVVMFVGLPAGGARAALALRDAAASDPRLPPLRAGLAAGPVVARDGDYYGPVVNLASRLTEVAPLGAILAPSSLAADVDDDGLKWVAAGRKRLRDIGVVETSVLERVG